MSVQLKRIIVFRIGHLGDTLVALRAFWAIRNQYPDAHITLLSNADPKNPHYVSAGSVLPTDGLFDSWISYPSGVSKLRSPFEMLRLGLLIRQHRPCGLFYLMPRIRTNYQIDRDISFFRFAGVQRIFGADFLRKNLLPPRAIPPVTAIESESDFFLRSLSNDGIEPVEGDGQDSLLLSQEELARGSEFLNLATPQEFSSLPRIAVAPGSKWESKVWDEERYATVVEGLIEKFNVFPIIFGGVEDKAKGDRLIERWSRGANAAGELSIREAAAALKGCPVYLGNDTGTMHLAAAVGTKCVSIFAAVDYPGRWFPEGRGHHILRRSVECEGCQTANCFNSKLCLELIGPEEVFRSCAQILSSEPLKEHFRQVGNVIV